MNRIVALVRWLCRQLTLLELFIAVTIILEVLDDRSDIKCKDYLKTQYPNYRKFHVDPEPPLSEQPVPKTPPADHCKDLLKSYQLKKGKKLKPVKRRDPSTCVLNSIRCPNCNAPGRYIYYNDGKKRVQLRCKVCDNLFQANKHHRPSKTKYWCPHCHKALYLWKKSEVMTIYKCPNDKCPRYLAAKNNLNRKEKELQQLKSSQFKLRYQYREYHFDPKDLLPASPQAAETNLERIHNSLDVLGLVLTLNVSYGHSARTTAHMLKNIFCIQLSYQTVLNYANAAAVLCHNFNMHHKGPIDSHVSGDETYIRVTDQWNYTWFTIGSYSRAIYAYHLSDSRNTRHALITLKETIRTSPNNETINFIADANPAYDAATLAINASSDGTPLKRRKVVGLKNVDEESSLFRAHKQIIERLNRTYKFHTRARCGFKNLNGAVALTVLFVTHYNFLRPHCSLGRKCPIPLDDLKSIQTIQGRWGKILEKATLLLS